MIVDTGCSLVRDAWAAQAFSVVEPDDVRWVFLSHDDHDHIGNLEFVLDACPNATLVANFSIVGRLAGDVELPLERMRWVDAGGSFDAGDRTFTCVRPPMFDSPATRALHDSATNLLWAADSFGVALPGRGLRGRRHPRRPLRPRASRCSTRGTRRGSSGSTSTGSPRTSSRAGRSHPTSSSSAHGPILRGAARSTTRSAVRSRSPRSRSRRRPGQETLDQMLAMFAAAPARLIRKEFRDGNTCPSTAAARRRPPPRPTRCGASSAIRPGSASGATNREGGEWLDGATERAAGRTLPRHEPSRAARSGSGSARSSPPTRRACSRGAPCRRPSTATAPSGASRSSRSTAARASSRRST